MTFRKNCIHKQKQNERRFSPISTTTYCIMISFYYFVLSLQLYDKASSRYEVPMELNTPNVKTEASSLKYEIKVTNRDNFAFEILRRSTGRKM